ncbi:MAG: BREX-1 system adenine-specific DNA-methyltransferase PglX [Halanaerobiales bacterium]|nr:BREX-1 system adenine-specific DNA-methyltransferase PglX [Halanaerobiales bacterium]
MNKSAIKKFAVNARRKLIEEDIIQKAYDVGIEAPDKIHDIEEFEGGFKVKNRENAKIFKEFQLKQRKELVKQVEEKGLDQVVEEVAYTWFNRFIALRFMEVNGYLPTGVRVLSSIKPGKIEPDIINEALNIDLDVDREVIYRLQDNPDTEELFKYLLVKQCNKLNEILPKMFEKIEDFTELLLPDYLLTEGSVIRELVELIDEYDWKIELSEDELKEEANEGEHGIEIVGWLYQYYISEKKDEVFAGLKKNKKITKENIPAATQLFTPKWIVKYMVENSLGRLWQESHPDEELKSNWKYYIEEAEQEPKVRAKLDELINKNLNPEEITFLDPAMGSGHILVYAFDVLYDIYLKAGYSEREIPRLILEKNIYGLDIDDRAGQLAYFALMMKARSKSRRIFRNPVNVNVCSIQESNGISKEVIDFLVNPKETEIEKLVSREDIEYLIDTFKDAKEYGSILEVKHIDFKTIEKRIDQIQDILSLDLFEMQYRRTILQKFVPILEQAKILSRKFDTVVTNPPYIGRKGMNPKLVKYVNENYKDSKSDLFAVFMDSCLRNTKKNGLDSMINQHSWMFLSSYEKLREKLILNTEIQSMIHLGPRAFEEIGGEVVQSTTFVIRNSSINNYEGQFIRVVDDNTASGKEVKTLEAIKNSDVDYRYITSTKDFSMIPGSPIAYWVSDKVRNIYLNDSLLDEIAKPRQGMATMDNNLFLRMWYEASIKNLGFQYENSEDALKSELKWFPYNKGGEYRKWFGNSQYVVNWQRDGVELKQIAQEIYGSYSKRIYNTQFFFKPSISWSKITSSKFSVRYIPQGYLFDVAGCAIYDLGENEKYILGLLNSKLNKVLVSALSPTLNYEVGTIKKIPIIINSSMMSQINELVKYTIDIAKIDWDSFETSWDFKVHPFLKHLDLGSNIKLSNVFNIWETETEEAFNQLKSNEEELNRIFIDIYGLQTELTPEVDDKDITIRKADRERDIKSFLSYAVGCMLGRYSLDEKELIYAGGEFNINRYSKFIPTGSNVIPIVDDEYFEEDITNRFIEFVKITFGEETLSENLEYIADTLGMKSGEMPKDTIRRYFIKDFYNDHVKTYKKRPIYWLFDSTSHNEKGKIKSKENGFKALIYMHRYDESTVARVRTDYLHTLQKKYDAEMKRLELILESDVPQREKIVATKKLEKLRKQQRECMEYDQVIAHIANQRISIDLDDGVKVNYMKFQDVEIPQGEGKKPLTANLLSKIKL